MIMLTQPMQTIFLSSQLLITDKFDYWFFTLTISTSPAKQFER